MQIYVQRPSQQIEFANNTYTSTCVRAPSRQKNSCRSNNWRARTQSTLSGLHTHSALFRLSNPTLKTQITPHQHLLVAIQVVYFTYCKSFPETELFGDDKNEFLFKSKVVTILFHFILLERINCCKKVKFKLSTLQIDMCRIILFF